ncbi:hypothetical protein BIY29_18795 [Brenneria alni]|uniref:Uncharacterized protein n=1 Tax=Brenneria alni TaxID=71656 RepID=A0A421DJ04_9GAMM|nr:hypothetical protein [Brenneria alni]RLM17947.1 hypothetical protein BIY29_18795 [Brenneria alni]
MAKWMRTIFFSDYLPSILCLLLLVKMDYAICSSWPVNQSVDNRMKLMLLFIHFIMIFAIFSPFIGRLLAKISNEKFKDFIGLPDKDKNITYIDLYDFLSGLALSAFYLSILLFTLKDVYEITGWFISGIYVFLMFASSISIASISLMRYIWLFAKFSKYTYAFSALLAGGICMAIISIAIRMAS